MDKGRTPIRACGPFLLAAVLAGCGESSRPSAQENRQLANAAEMLDLAPAELDTIDNRGAANGLDEPQRDPFESPRQSEQAAPDTG